MIDAAEFFPHWKRLCSRFSRPYDEEQAVDYLEYLDAAGMSTDAAVAAARDLWARCEFFPRPADFLAADEGRGWRAALAWARGYSPTLDAERARALHSAISPRALRAIEEVGGIDQLRESKNLLRVREAFRDAFERCVSEEVQHPMLEVSVPVQLPPPRKPIYGSHDPVQRAVQVLGVPIQIAWEREP